MWKSYNDYYTVSDEGQVRNRRGRILKGDLNSKGYRRITINGRHIFIHKLVGILFIPNPLNLPQINHKDLNKLNNKKDNLEWCNNQYNMLHAYKNGTKHGKAKLLKIELLSLIDDLKIMTVGSVAIKYNLNVQSVYAIRKGRNIKRLTY